MLKRSIPAEGALSYGGGDAVAPETARLKGSRFESSGVEVRRVSKRLARRAAWAALLSMVVPVGLATALGGLGAMFGFGDALVGPLAILWLVGWIGGVPAAALVSLIASARYRRPFTKVVAQDGELWLGGAGRDVFIPREQMEGALEITELKGESLVEVTLTTGDSLFVKVAGPAEARALVGALRLAPSQRRAVITLGGARDPLGAGCAAVVLGMLATALSTCAGFAGASALHSRTLESLIPYLLGVVFVGVTMVVARMAVPKRLVVGADGVLVEGAFRDRFYPRSQIELVDHLRPHLSLVVREGDQMKRVNLTAESGERQDALLHRIRAALALQPREGAEERAALLGRGNESIETWRERVRRLAASGGDYRARALPADALLGTAASMDAPADVRLGAAMAIAFGEDDEAKKELRVSTEAIANDKLRVALERAAEGEADEEAIEAALEEERRLRRGEG